MIVKFLPLGKRLAKNGTEWEYLKCFYGKENTLTYAEFYLAVDRKHKLIKFESKEPFEGWANVLSRAFTSAMRRW
jgi:hypothetical protein